MRQFNDRISATVFTTNRLETLADGVFAIDARPFQAITVKFHKRGSKK